MKDADVPAACGSFSSISVVGMLLYIYSYTRPNIAYAVNCCARYMFFPKNSHETALKRIVRDMKKTKVRALILNPRPDAFKLDCYPNAYFSRIYQHELTT